MFKVQIIFIFVLSYFFALQTLSAKENFKQYKIIHPNKILITKIEHEGGIINQYIPGEYVEVILPDKLAQKIKAEGYILSVVKAESYSNNLTDTLSSDHTIGFSYHSYDAVSFILDSLEDYYSNICRVISIGQTVEGREMWAACISDYPDIEEAEPEVKYVANMHGDEIITQEMMLVLIKYLLENYASNNRVQQLVNTTEIWIMPNMNFDGSQNLQRTNANDFDLNRNFPDRDPEINNRDSMQIETLNMINWSKSHNFVLSANFHSGALVVNYPWDRNLDGSDNYAATPDDKTFRSLALTYSRNNADMYNSPYFMNGITNGAQWYQVTGGMMDWNYNFLSCMDLTIELSSNNMPQSDSLLAYWDKNKESLISLLEQVNRGLRGTVKDSLSHNAIPATVKVSEIGKSISVDPDSGDYYRLMQPGNYQVLFESEGYYPEIVNDVAIDSGSITYLDVFLKPIVYYTLSGNIIDTLSGGYLPDTKLYFYKNLSLVDSCTSNVDGEYSIVLPVNNYLLKIKKEGYFERVYPIGLFDNTIFDIHLEKIIPGKISGSVTIMDEGNFTGSIVYCQNLSDTLFYQNHFEINNLVPGEIIVFAYKFGYKTTLIDTVLQNGGMLNLDGILLSPGNNEYFNDFENADEDFTEAGDWLRDMISFGPSGAYSGYFAWGTNPHGNYASGTGINSLESKVFSLQGMVIPALQLYHWYDIETNYDGANVKISDEYGRDWQILKPNPDYPVEMLTDEYKNPMSGQPVYSGTTGGWEKISFNLSQYKTWPFVKFRFDLGVDNQKTAAGWYLDDFKIFDANATGVNFTHPEMNWNSLTVDIYPNPANPSTRFLIHTGNPGPVDILIYNIQGQLINKTSVNTQANHPVEWRWEGVNFSRNAVASGIYFVKIQNSYETITRKLVLIR